MDVTKRHWSIDRPATLRSAVAIAAAHPPPPSRFVTRRRYRSGPPVPWRTREGRAGGLIDRARDLDGRTTSRGQRNRFLRSVRRRTRSCNLNSQSRPLDKLYW